MSLKDEFRKFIHPYDEEDEPEEYQEEERPERPRRDEERRSDDRRSKVVNINSAGPTEWTVAAMSSVMPLVSRRDTLPQPAMRWASSWVTAAA